MYDMPKTLNIFAKFIKKLFKKNYLEKYNTSHRFLE